MRGGLMTPGLCDRPLEGPCMRGPGDCGLGLGPLGDPIGRPIGDWLRAFGPGPNGLIGRPALGPGPLPLAPRGRPWGPMPLGGGPRG